MKKTVINTAFFGELFAMNFSQAAHGRRAQCVRILSHFPILVQDRLAKVRRGKKKKTTPAVYVPGRTKGRRAIQGHGVRCAYKAIYNEGFMGCFMY